MKTNKKVASPALARDSLIKRTRSHRVEAGVVSGALAGAAVGAFAGVTGAIAGAVVGGAAGGAAGLAMSNAGERDDARTSPLDEEIGTSGGEMGAPSLEHPPSTGESTTADVPSAKAGHQ